MLHISLSAADRGDVILSLTLTAPPHTLLPALPPSHHHTLTISFSPSHSPSLPLETLFPAKMMARPEVRGQNLENMCIAHYTIKLG